jgi:ATP-grasp domain, R2K clade family 2
MNNSIKNLKGFVCQNATDFESKQIKMFCVHNDLPCKFHCYNPTAVVLETGWVPYGDVPWTTALLNRKIVPNYFPEFLKKDFVSRKIWTKEKWDFEKCFIKPADRHKRFTGFVTSGTWKGKRKGPFVCSEIVTFKNEWRYYVSDAKILTAHWYWGEDHLMQPAAPNLDFIKFPENWCGAVDFGELSNGKIELIESHPPFACGWYGKDINLFVEFLAVGWQWLLDKKDL